MAAKLLLSKLSTQPIAIKWCGVVYIYTYRKLRALGQIVDESTTINLNERYGNKEALHNALSEVCESIAAELTHLGDVAEAEEL